MNNPFLSDQSRQLLDIAQEQISRPSQICTLSAQEKNMYIGATFNAFSSVLIFPTQESFEFVINKICSESENQTFTFDEISEIAVIAVATLILEKKVKNVASYAFVKM